MNVDLSRHVARLKMFDPIRHLTPMERRAFNAAIEQADAFEDLPSTFQDMIRVAEVARDAYRAELQQSRAASLAAGASRVTLVE